MQCKQHQNSKVPLFIGLFFTGNFSNIQITTYHDKLTVALYVSEV